MRLFLVSFMLSLLFSRIATHQFKEVAWLASGRCILVEESQIFLVKLLKKLIPANFLKRILTSVAGEIDAQDTGITVASRSFNGCRLAPACLRPSPDLIVIRGDLGFSSHITPPFVTCPYEETSNKYPLLP